MWRGAQGHKSMVSITVPPVSMSIPSLNAILDFHSLSSELLRHIVHSSDNYGS